MWVEATYALAAAMKKNCFSSALKKTYCLTRQNAMEIDRTLLCKSGCWDHPADGLRQIAHCLETLNTEAVQESRDIVRRSVFVREELCVSQRV